MDTQGGDEWSTPDWLFTTLDRELHFDLDAAASIENFKVFKFYDREANGLKLPWAQPSVTTVWCNPPYSNPAAWVDKAIAETEERYCRAVLLLPSDTSTKWFHRGFTHASEVRFLTPRVRFGGAKGSPRWGSVLFFFGLDCSKKVWVWDTTKAESF